MDCIPVIPDTITTKQARELNPLVLAFVGDSVQTLYVRTHFGCDFYCKKRRVAQYSRRSDQREGAG